MPEEVSEEQLNYELADRTVSLLGPTLIATAVCCRDRKLPEAWQRRTTPVHESYLERLRFLDSIAARLREHDVDAVVRAWFIGANPSLNEDQPIFAIRGRRFAEVEAAATHFLEDSFF